MSASPVVALDEIEGAPQIHRRYQVPCILIQTGLRSRMWVPILGEDHDDADFLNFPIRHFHPDLRFLTRRQIRVISRFGMDTETQVGIMALWESLGAAAGFLTVIYGSERCLAGPHLRPRLCRRRMPPYPDVTACSVILILEEAFDGQAAVEVPAQAGKAACRRCPHRGLPLQGLPPNPDGTITCRGHGLRISPEGIVVRRPVDPETYRLGEEDGAADWAGLPMKRMREMVMRLPLQSRGNASLLMSELLMSRRLQAHGLVGTDKELTYRQGWMRAARWSDLRKRSPPRLSLSLRVRSPLSEGAGA